MDKLTYPLDPEKPALCVSTIDYLTAHGFISPANDSGVTLQTVLQELQTGDGDEQDELTDDDENDEQLAAQFIEPKGPNPQQQMFLEKPSGPNLLVEASKALIKREPVPPEASLLPEYSTPVLQFTGRDELVMPRALLKDTPTSKRKSTFKPLVAKSHKDEAQALVKTLILPTSADTQDSAFAIKSVDTCLKLGPAASRQLFNESQRVLAHVQSLLKTDSSAMDSESLLFQAEKSGRPPSPILLPRRPSSLSTPHDITQIGKLDVQKMLQDNLAELKTPSSHTMSQLMEDLDRWGGGALPAISPFADSSGSTVVTSPLMSVESFIPSRKLSQSIRIEIPLKPRNPSASPLKRARSSNDTDEEAVGKSFKKNKVESASKEAGTDHFVAEPKTFPSKTAKLISISTPASLSTNAQHSSVAPDEMASLPKIEHKGDGLSGHVSGSSEVKTTTEETGPQVSAITHTAEWAAISSKSVTFQSIADMYDNSDNEEVDELASSVEDIEDFCEMAESPPVLGDQREEIHISNTDKDAQVTAGPLVSPSRANPHINRENQVPEVTMSATESDELVFTPSQWQSERVFGQVGSTQRDKTVRQSVCGESTMKIAHMGVENDSEKRVLLQAPKEQSDFFMEERVQIKKLDGGPSESKNKEAKTINEKARVPLTQLNTDSLAALVAFKRRKKLENGKITDFFGQKHTRERSETPLIDRKNVNGYLLLRSRNDLIRAPPPTVSTSSADQPTEPKAESVVRAPAMTQTPKKDKTAGEVVRNPGLPLKPKQAPSIAPPPAQNTLPAEPEYDLTNLVPLRCFGSFRLLQNSAVDRALDMHNVEVIYPDEDDPVSLRAIALTRTNGQTVVPHISQPDIILSPRSCLFYYPLNCIYQMTTVLDTDFSQKRMHHSKILLDALRLFSQEYDKIVLVMEMFEPASDMKNTSNKPVMNATTITPAIKRALEKLYADISALAEQIQRPLGEELDIELLHAVSPLQAAAFVRERLDLRLAKDIQLGQLGWNQKLYEMFRLNDLTAHHLVIEAGSLEAFQEMEEEERNKRFLHVLGCEKMNEINRILRSQAAFGTLIQAENNTANDMSNSTFTSMNNDTTDWPMQRTKSFEDSYYEDPNYSAYNHLPESFSQANQTQIVEESFVNARSVYNDNNGIAANYMQDEHMMAYSPQGGYSSQEGRYDIDELDELILDDADVEAEVNNPLSEPFKSVRPTVAPSHDRPFTPIHELGNFWPANDQAMGLRGGFNVIEPFNDGVVYGMHEDGNEQIHEFEFDDVLGTISEFDPNRNAMY